MNDLVRGGLLTKRPLLLAEDGEVFLCVCDNDIRVYSARTGLLLSTLRGHSAEVTALAHHPLNSRQVLSTSLDGSVACWDLSTGRLLQRTAVGEPLHGMVASRQAALLYVSIRVSSSEGRVQALQLPSCQPLEGRWRCRDVPRLVASSSGRYIVALDRHSLHVWAAGASPSVKPMNLKHTKTYTCAAMDPTDTILAAGDVSGRILLWHDFPAAVRGAQLAAMGAGRQHSSSGVVVPPVTTVHWHAHPVGALCFSSDSVYLLSGGQEGVLVHWAVATGARNYLPRLGGPISSITTCASHPARYLLGQADNSVRGVNTATMSVDLSLHGMRPAPAPLQRLLPGHGHWAPKDGVLGASGSSLAAWKGGRGGGRPVVQPGSGHLVLPCEHSLLQFYDVLRDRHVGRLQVSLRNPVSLTLEGGAPLAATGHPQVTLLAFSSDASAMATLDVWPDTGSLGGVSSSLNFWDSTTAAAGSSIAGSSSPYVLNTRSDSPHPGAEVTGCAYHPQQHMVATCATDGEFRVWVRMSVRRSAVAAAAAGDASRSGRQTATAWHCRSVGSYKQQPMAHCCFSRDGSLLAVAAGGTATLWEPSSNSLVAALLPRAPGAGHAAMVAAEEGGRAAEVLVQLGFLAGSPHLVGLYTPAAAAAAAGSRSSSLGAPQRVVVWDLLTSSVAWSVSVHCCSFALDLQLPLIAVGVPATSDLAAAAAGIQQQQGQPQQQEQDVVTAPAADVAAAAGAGSKGGRRKAAAHPGQEGELDEEGTVSMSAREQKRAARWKELCAKRDASRAAEPMEEDLAPIAAGSGASKKGKKQQQQQQQQEAEEEEEQQEGPAGVGVGGQGVAAKQQQQQSVGTTRAGLVLVFSVASPMPVFSCMVPRASPHHLLFVPRQSELGALTADALPGSISPLLIMDGERRISFAVSPGLQLQKAEQQQEDQAAAEGASALQAAAAAGRQQSVFDSVFGIDSSSAAAAAEGPGGRGSFNAVAAKEAVQRLFDAPSHVLPPPTSLVPTMLQLLLQTEGA